MKAHKGEKIVCDCDRHAGSFRRGVDDRASISSEDISISLPGVPEGHGCWVCLTCNMTVARFSGGHWQVRTRNGWLE